MKKTTFSFLFGVWFLGWVGADGKAEPGGGQPAYELKKRSVCKLPDGFRSPFLPEGWKRPAEPSRHSFSQVVPAFMEKDFVLTSVLLGTPSLAVINGHAYSENEYVRMPKEHEAKGRVRLVRIGDGTVLLEAGKQQLIVHQRRTDLPSQRPRLEVLPANR